MKKAELREVLLKLYESAEKGLNGVWDEGRMGFLEMGDSIQEIALSFDIDLGYWYTDEASSFAEQNAIWFDKHFGKNLGPVKELQGNICFAPD